MIGFFIGPFYPVGLYVLTKVIPQELHIGALGGPFNSAETLSSLHLILVLIFAPIGFTASLGQAGSAAFPFMTGAIASKTGVQVMQPIMVGLLVGIGIFWALLPRQLSTRSAG